MQYLKTITVIAISCSFMYGCSNDPRSASKANFKLAINQHLQKSFNPLCQIVSPVAFPFGLRNDAKFNPGVSKAQLDSLTLVGILISKDKMISAPYTGMTAEVKDGPGREYSVSELGMKSYQEKLPPNEQWPQGGAGFCFGTAEVDEIIDYDPPSQGENVTQTKVKFSYKVLEPASWAKSNEGGVKNDLSANFPLISKAEKGQLQMEWVLIRSAKGWSVRP